MFLHYSPRENRMRPSSSGSTIGREHVRTGPKAPRPEIPLPPSGGPPPEPRIVCDIRAREVQKDRMALPGGQTTIAPESTEDMAEF